MNTKKKILFLVTQSEFGGAQRFIYTLIRGMRNISAIHHEVVVAAGPEGDDENGLLSILEKEGINTMHLKYSRRSVNPFFDFLGLIEIYKLIKKEKPDILFLCSTKAGFLGSLAAKFNSKFKIQNAKLIYRIGGWTFNDPWPKWKKKIYFWFEKISAKWKDIIINNAESDRKQAIKSGIKPRERIITIYNGIDVNNLDFFAKQEAGIILNIQPSFIIGTIANLYPSKGLKYLVEAANLAKYKLQNTEYKFVVIGEGRERKKLENLIKKYNLENNFFLVGAIPGAYKYLRAFDIFVLPSLKEGFPWVILEAMAAQVPIIATKVGAISEIIDDGKNGILVEPADFDGLAKAILRLAEDKSLQERLSMEARKTVEARFGLDKMVSEVEKLF